MRVSEHFRGKTRQKKLCLVVNWQSPGLLSAKAKRRCRAPVAGCRTLQIGLHLRGCTWTPAGHRLCHAEFGKPATRPKSDFDPLKLQLAGNLTPDPGRTSDACRCQTEVAGGLIFAPRVGRCISNTADRFLQPADLSNGRLSPSSYFDSCRPMPAGIRSSKPA